MKRKIEIEIDCEDKYCGDCIARFWDVCHIFGCYLSITMIKRKTKWLRDQACLKAEVKNG